MAQAEEASALVWRFEALEDGQASAYGAQCRARATAADGRSFVVRVSFPEGVEPPRYGDAFEARSRLSRPEGTTASYCWQPVSYTHLGLHGQSTGLSGACGTRLVEGAPRRPLATSVRMAVNLGGLEMKRCV